MNRDFTFNRYKLLLQSLNEQGYTFHNFSDYCLNFKSPDNSPPISYHGTPDTEYRLPITDYRLPDTPGKFVILRHDVDAKPQNSLRFAQWEHDNGIRGTYYFRSGPTGFDKTSIRLIASLGHEIGYHYETLNQVLMQQPAPRSKNHPSFTYKILTLWNTVHNIVKHCATEKHPPDKQTLHHAYQLFTVNLRKLRRIAPVSTICMHGSPLSPHDNRLIWTQYNYREHDIIGEPYFDTDFSRVAYLTDTGRRWDGQDVSVRDKIGDEEMEGTEGTRRTKRTKGTRRTKRTKGTRRTKRTKGTKRGGDEGTRGRGYEGKTECDEVNKSEIENPKSEIRKLHAPCSTPCRSTNDLISAIKKGSFPDQVMLTLHPQRWEDDWWPWMKELIGQSIKNPLKKLLVRSTSYPDPS